MIRIAVFSACLVSGAPLSAEVVEATSDRFLTRDTVTVAATPLETWLALIQPARWWSDKHSWSGDARNMVPTPQGGGCFCYRIPAGDRGNAAASEGSVRHAEVIQAIPMKTLRLRGGFGPLQAEPGDGILTVTFSSVPGGTRIVWEYHYGGPMRYEIVKIAPAVDAVMSEQLKGLQSHLGALIRP